MRLFSRWRFTSRTNSQAHGFAPHVADRDGGSTSPLLVLVGRFWFPQGSIRFILLPSPFVWPWSLHDGSRKPFKILQRFRAFDVFRFLHMDYATRQFINLTKKFRKEFRLLFSKLNSALDKQTNAISEATKAAQTQQRIHEKVDVTVTNFPEAVETRKSAADRTSDSQQHNRLLLVQWLTFLAIVIYAVLVYLQYREMINATGATQQAVQESRFNRQQAEKSLAATVQQFQLDQRAWVGPEQIANTLGDDKKTLTGIGFILRNSGKTPALNVEYHCSINAITVPYRTLPPVSSYTFKYPGETKKGPLGSRAVIQPNMTVTIWPQNVLTAEQISAVRAGTVIGYMYGLITYDDVFKQHRHTAKFCVYFEPDFWGTHSCPTYNDTD